MAIKVCPRCGEQIVAPAYVKDVIHKCNSNSEFSNYEDVVKTGTYVDEETGSSVEVHNTNLQGLGPGEDGENYLTSRGNRKATHRTRRHYEYVKF